MLLLELCRSVRRDSSSHASGTGKRHSKMRRRNFSPFFFFSPGKGPGRGWSGLPCSSQLAEEELPPSWGWGARWVIPQETCEAEGGVGLPPTHPQGLDDGGCPCAWEELCVSRAVSLTQFWLGTGSKEGGPPLPPDWREVISGMSPCISWNSVGFLSHPVSLLPFHVFSTHDVVWEFHNMSWDSASFSGRLEAELVDESKVPSKASWGLFSYIHLGLFPLVQALGTAFLKAVQSRMPQALLIQRG